MFGADVAALRRFAWSLRHRKREIEATRRRLAVVVDGMSWSGDDHDRFVDEWRRVHSPALMAIVTEMAQASGQAAHHADRQERASHRSG